MSQGLKYKTGYLWPHLLHALYCGAGGGGETGGGLSGP